MSTGLTLTLLVTLSQLTMSLCLRQYFYQCYVTGLRLRTSVITSVYAKSLVLSSSARLASTTGEITNLMSTDAQRLQDLTPYLHAIWYSFIQISLAIYFLWQELHTSCLAGITVIIIMMPITKRIAKFTGSIQKVLMKDKDERLKVNNEALTGAKVIKMNAWEKSVHDKIQRLRTTELTTFKRYMLYQAASGTLWSMVPLLVAVATFTAYVSSGNTLDVSTALTSLALFEILRFPLFMLPNVVNNLVEASVSINRIEDFLNLEEREPVKSLPDGEKGVKLNNSTFVWEGKRVLPGSDPDTPPMDPVAYENVLLRELVTPSNNTTATDNNHSSLLHLRNVTLTASPGDLIAVVGSVGSGKSTLLSGILGECRCLAGDVAVGGKMAYVSQKAFIMNDTVRSNITFSPPDTPLDAPRYDAAISACALTQDLASLSAGDETEIGEKGINLSGGQKARVSLARAVYSDADVYLLDDPLSAVDAHVGKHLFNECIVKLPTVVLVTNALQYLSHPKVTRIVVLENGAITESGTYKDLMAKKEGSFHSLLKSYHESSSASMNLDAASEAPVPPPPPSTPGSSSASSPPKSPSSPPKSPSKSSSSAAAPAAASANIITDELLERETGSVSSSVYYSWAKAAGGVFPIVVTLFLYLATMFIEIFNRYWLSYWSEHAGGSQVKFLVIYALINLADGVSMFSRQVFLYLSCLKASKVLFETLLTTVMRAPMSFFDTTPIGRVLNRFSKDMYTVDSQLPTTLRAYLGTLSSVLSTLFVISTVTPWFIVCLVPIAAYYVSNQRFFVATYRELRRLDSVSRSPIYALFGETLDGVATVRAFGAENILKARVVDLLDSNQTAFFLTFVAQCWLAVRLELAGTAIITFACLCVVLQHSARAGDEAFAGAAGLSISFALSVTQSLNWSVRMASDLEAQMISVERVQQYCEIVSEAPSETERDRMLPPNFPNGRIEFKNVQMRYRPNLPLVLKGLTLAIPAGARVGVVGRTGAGKSSIMVALMRLVELSAGRIEIDGEDVSKLGLHLLRSKVAIVPQDPVLFSGTVRSNLDPFEQHAETRLWDVLRRVGLLDDSGGASEGGATTARIKGLGDVVEEDGANFSVGQRQLLVIARALLSDCSIVLMDEATAAIDVRTDALIQNAIRTEFKNATTIVVAHRINTIMDSTHILVMDEGRVGQFDSPKALLEKGGLFLELVNAHESSHNDGRSSE
jgi:ABC-type multidrug transport system fused ATPase/permease subunit